MAFSEKVAVFESDASFELVDGLVNDIADEHTSSNTARTPWLASSNPDFLAEGNHPDFSAHTRIFRRGSDWYVTILDRKVDFASRHYETRLDWYWRTDEHVYGSCYRIDYPKGEKIKQLFMDLDGPIALNGIYNHLVENMPRPRRELLAEYYHRFPGEYGCREKSRTGDQSLVAYHRQIRRGGRKMRRRELGLTGRSPNLDREL